MAKIASGLPIAHPSGYTGWAGRAAALPSGAPAFTQFTMMFLSVSLSRRSFRNSPCAGSACQGGIVPRVMFVAIERVHGRVSEYVRSDMGAMAPGRWQTVQFL